MAGFRIGNKAGEMYQGFYIYRNDRLLQIGGWSDTASPSQARQLARIVLEDTAAIGPFLTMNPEKSGLKFEPSFHDAINRAASMDGTTFLDYIQDAESIYTDANKRMRRFPRMQVPAAESLRRIRSHTGVSLRDTAPGGRTGRAHPGFSSSRWWLPSLASGRGNRSPGSA